MLILTHFWSKIHINDRDKNTSYTEKYQDHVSCIFFFFFFFVVVVAKLYVLMINLANQLLFKQKKFSQQLYWSNS